MPKSAVNLFGTVVFAFGSMFCFGSAFGQPPGIEAGSAAAARFNAGQANDAIMDEAEWNVAKKLGKHFTGLRYKETTQDFTPFETIENSIGFAQQWAFKVVSVIDKTNVVLSLGKYVFWLEGFPTDNLTDGDSIRVLDPIKFTKTKSYTTVTGAKKTVQAFKMIEKDEFEKHLAEKADEKKERDLIIRRGKSVPIEFKDGKSADLIFVDIKKGKVILEDLEGNELEHALADFTPESSALLRKLFKNKAKTPPAKK